MQKIIKFWLPPVLWAGVIFLFSSYPTSGASRIYWQDFIVKKIAHIIEFGLLTTLLYRALKESGIEKTRAAVWAILLSSFYGITDEFHQSFTPGREPTVRDVIFDTIGSVLAIYFIWKLLPKMPPRLKKLAKSWELI